MSIRSQNTERCRQCRMPPSLCICSLMPRIETRTRLCLVIHRFEDKKPTNTGRLATQCLVNSEVLVRGDAAQREQGYAAGEDVRSYVLFPHEDALALDELPADPRPITLVVPDGNWRQASKVRARMPGLMGVPSVRLPDGPSSRYRLRASPHEHGLATLEAIARAYGILEGAPVQDELEAIFLAMVERTLWFRGLLAASEVKSGIPDGAQRQNARHGLPPL